VGKSLRGGFIHAKGFNKLERSEGEFERISVIEFGIAGRT